MVLVRTCNTCHNTKEPFRSNHSSGNGFPIFRSKLFKKGGKHQKLDELAGLLNAVSAQLAKAKVEIEAKIGDLETALANVELPAEATTALDNLKNAAQILDNVVPDA